MQSDSVDIIILLVKSACKKVPKYRRELPNIYTIHDKVAISMCSVLFFDVKIFVS